MKRYIIELEGRKIFSYEAEGCDKNFRCRLMKPHGDKFYSTEKYLRYWSWFEAETAAEEPNICFICSAEELFAVEKLKNAAPNINDSSWQMSELKKFFMEYRDEPLKENFHWDGSHREIIFDGGKILRLDGVNLSDESEPAEEISPPKSKFRVRVYSPPAEQKNFEPPEKILEPEKNIPESSASPAELKEKISAEDLRTYIEEQTDGQCNGISFKK